MRSTLNEVFVELGFCLPLDAIDALMSDPPESVDAFADAVIRADDMDPVLIDSGLRRSVVRIVNLRLGQVLSRVPNDPT